MGRQIDDVFGLVGQMRATILHLGDPAVGVGFALPLLVRDLFVLAFPVEPSESLRPRARRPVRSGPLPRIRRWTYSCQSSPVSRRTMLFIAASASRVVASTPTVLPLKRPAFLGHLQHKAEGLLMNRQRQSVANSCQARMVRRLFAQRMPRNARKLRLSAHRQAMPRWRAEAFEVTHQQHR